MRLSGPVYGNEKNPDYLVLMLHGVGASGDDLIALSPILENVLPDAVFHAPNGHESFDMAPFGHQWFSLRSLQEEDLLRGLDAATAVVNAYIDELLAHYNLTADRLIVFGFSQGAMTSLHMGLRRKDSPLSIISCSGALVGPERLQQEIRSRPKVLMVHGEQDTVVPFQALGAASKALTELDVPLQATPLPGLAHGIDERAIEIILTFLIDYVVGLPEE